MLHEGGIFPWKVQRLKLAPSLGYRSIYKPLEAPKGKAWNLDAGKKEWILVAEEKELSSKIVHACATVGDTEGNMLLPHNISTSDTFRNICLMYNITPLELRRANGDFVEEDLSLVPSPLMIPLRDVVASEAVAEEVEPLSEIEIVSLLLDKCRGMSSSEARAYLMLSDWDLNEALGNALNDGF